MRLGFAEDEPAVHLGGRFDDRDTPAEYVYPTPTKRYGLSPSETPIGQYEHQSPVSHRLRCAGQAINLLGGEEPVVVVEGQRGKLDTSRWVPPNQPLVDSASRDAARTLKQLRTLDGLSPSAAISETQFVTAARLTLPNCT
jgi:hypothetical protein